MTKLSRSKIELYLECPRCFWLEMKEKIKRPSPAPYTINSAIDYLLKQEFDVHREKGTPHPIMVKHEIKAIPFKDANMNKWRHNFTGIQFHHEPTDFLITGAVDDVWINPKGELIIVDYKATGANQHQVYDSYRRQMEIYQWLFHKNGYRVSPKGYFVFARVSKADGFKSQKDKPQLSFDIFVEPHEGDYGWVDRILTGIKKTLNEKTPDMIAECNYCAYTQASARFLSSEPVKPAKK